ncbi:MAG: hypothetical protein V4714_08335 [Bacteroidota bacterium]
MKTFSEAYALTESFAIRYIKLVMAIVVVLVALSLRGCFSSNESQFPTVVRTDTNRVAEMAEPVRKVPIPERWQPATVWIYLPDTIARSKVEKGDIVTSTKFAGGRLVVEKISPIGISTKAEYKVPELAAVWVDVEGNVNIVEDKKAKRREWWRKSGNKVLIGAALVGGFVLGTTIK